MTKHFVVLASIGYDVTVADNQVIFEQSPAVWSTHTVFAFERPTEINNSPGIWYLVHLDSSSQMVPASHIVAAHAWCCEQFGKSFEPYRGALK